MKFVELGPLSRCALLRSQALSIVHVCVRPGQEISSPNNEISAHAESMHFWIT